MTSGDARTWILHPADRLNVFMALAAPSLLFLPYVIAFPPIYIALYGTFLFLIIGKSNYILHLHIHRPFCRSNWQNLLVDVGLGLTTAMVASNWRIQHLHGHHKGIDVPYRGDRTWQLEKYTPLRAASYSILSIPGTLFWPYVESFQKGIARNIVTPINYRWAFFEQTIFLVFLSMLLVWKPWLTIGYILPWYFVTHLVTHYVDYLNHYGCDENSDDIYECANNSLSERFNSSTHNFGYHTVHHIRPTAHWTELPAIHDRIPPGRIPERLLKSVSWSGLLFPYHFYLAYLRRM